MGTEPIKQIDLHLPAGAADGQESGGGSGGQGPGRPGNSYSGGSRPVMGWIAVACAFLGIVSWGIVFVPLGFVCSVIALFMGQGMWAFIGLALSVVGLFSSPLLLGVLGLGAMAAYFGIPV